MRRREFVRLLGGAAALMVSAPVGAGQTVERADLMSVFRNLGLVGTFALYDARRHYHYGVIIIIKAKHHCMTTRGIHKPDTDLVTSRMLGCFRDNPLTPQEFLTMVD